MVNGTTQSRSCFRCPKKYQRHLTERFHRNFRTNGKLPRSISSGLTLTQRNTSVQRCSSLHSAHVTTYRMAFVPVRKPYRRGLLFRYKNGALGVFSVMEPSCAVRISKVESHISDRCSYYTG